MFTVVFLKGKKGNYFNLGCSGTSGVCLDISPFATVKNGNTVKPGKKSLTNENCLKLEMCKYRVVHNEIDSIFSEFETVVTI